MTLLSNGLLPIANSGIDGLTPRYNIRESTGNYVKEATFVCRFTISSSFQLVLPLQYNRSSIYGATTSSPLPRGHTFNVALNDQVQYLHHVGSNGGPLPDLALLTRPKLLLDRLRQHQRQGEPADCFLFNWGKGPHGFTKLTETRLLPSRSPQGPTESVCGRRSGRQILLRQDSRLGKCNSGKSHSHHP